MAVMLTVAGPLVVAMAPSEAAAQAVATDAVPFKSRNIGVSREAATRKPLGEADQAIVDGWPIYRSERGQQAFNDAMATLKATDGAAPNVKAFNGCFRLECNLALPALGADGWLSPGRVWVSPTEYLLVAHSPRTGDGRSSRRRGYRDMKVFVFHEFANSSHNTDAYDTISSHKGSVFVPLYMSKQATDAKGRRFVTVVQVSPYDVVSIHATNWGSAGPGIEVAKNSSDTLEPLQGLAGILVATMIKTAAPGLRVVNHRGNEGLPMLQMYDRRLAVLRDRPGEPAVALPFVPAQPQRVAAATGRLSDVIGRGGAAPLVPVVEREIVPPKPVQVARSRQVLIVPVPVPASPVRVR